jgi:hypothetical protein
LVIGMVAVMMMFATMLMTQAGQRYHHAQFIRDRLQANQCAQAGLLWTQSRIRSGEEMLGIHSLDFGEVGLAEVVVTRDASGIRLAATGTALRDSTPQATRRLVRVLEARP